MDRATLAVFILHSPWAALGRRLLPTARLRKNRALGRPSGGCAGRAPGSASLPSRGCRPSTALTQGPPENPSRRFSPG